jgi:hypothetical protein
MASREFADSAGLAWTAWDVVPQAMSNSLKRLTGSSEERRSPWLAFQSIEGHKRRLSPVPEGWELGDDASLELLCNQAAPVPPAPARRTWDR